MKQAPDIANGTATDVVAGADVAAVLAALGRQAALLERLEHAVRDLAAAVREARPPRHSSGWLTAREAGEALGMSVKAVYADVEAGGPLAAAASRLGRRLRFHRDGLDQVLLRRRGVARTIPAARPVAGKA